MKCPHCLVSFHAEWTDVPLPSDNEAHWHASVARCPACQKNTILLKAVHLNNRKHSVKPSMMVYPKGLSRTPLSPDIPEHFASEYKESCTVLGDSEKASAALSRRCLQNLLLEKATVKKSDSLDKQIQQVLDAKTLPSHLADAIDSVRAIGNFAAHPIKSSNTGEIIDVEPGEAEWLLDTLEGLFDFYFVQPAILQQKRDALNKKLADAGKPPLKQGAP